MKIQTLKEIHSQLANDDWAGAANRVLTLLGRNSKVETKTQAIPILRSLFQHLLDNDLYLEAATLQWGPDIFNTEPESVQRSFTAIKEANLVLFMGGSSLGKSYGVGAWMVLDYLRDPLYTSIKLGAVNEKHLRENLFPHMVRMVRNCIIPLHHKFEIRESDMWLGIKEAGFEFGISGLSFKQSQETSGAFKGYKFIPVRKKLHPKFGFHSRLRVLLDEGQNVPGGPFQDFNSLKASMNEAGRVKLAVAFNPENLLCTAVQMAEPEQGWQQEDMETLYDYIAKSGWRVCRLDGKLCENIKQKKTVYDGLQTYDAFVSYLKSGGDASAAYSCFARGWPPMKGSVNTLIPPMWPQEARGEATFIEKPIMVGSVDLAFMGKDTAQMVVGRWGRASGFRHQNGTYEEFRDRLNVAASRPRHVLQIDQILPLEKHDDAGRMAEEIMGRCRMLGIKPERLAVDKMQPLSEPVLTPTGWKTIGSIKVGDMVIGSSGSTIAVTGVYPQKSRDTWRVTMNDGSWTRCGGGHLWSIEHTGSGKRIVAETDWIRENGVMRHGQPKWSIPMISSPVEYDCHNPLPIHPYLLGCLLGDGNLRKNSIRFSNIDEFILNKIRSLLPGGYELQHTDRCNYSIRNSCGRSRNRNAMGQFYQDHKILNKLRALGLAGLKSTEKIIPEIYMRSSATHRLMLLQGLMDTDGFCQAGGFGIRLTNEVMINQIIELVESLGGSGRVKRYHPRGQKNPNFRATLIPPSGCNLFSMPRKADAVRTRRYPFRRTIVRIEREHDEDSVCLRVDSPDHLYVTRHGILTHNTGIGFGTYSHLNKVWGQIYGIGWGDKATAAKILDEDNEGADKQCDGVMSEMWWAFRRWLDPRCQAVLINPIIPPQPIHTQLTSRRYKHGKNGIKVESKEEYIARNQHSPDESDSMIQLVHLIRFISPVLPGLSGETSPQVHGRPETIDGLRPKRNIPIDEYDSIGIDGDEQSDHIEVPS